MKRCARRKSDWGRTWRLWFHCSSRTRCGLFLLMNRTCLEEADVPVVTHFWASSHHDVVDFQTFFTCNSDVITSGSRDPDVWTYNGRIKLYTSFVDVVWFRSFLFTGFQMKESGVLLLATGRWRPTDFSDHLPDVSCCCDRFICSFFHWFIGL